MSPKNMQALEAEIESAYNKSGNSLGWRLLASPISVLNAADIAFIGLNPGGNEESSEHSRFAPSRGSSYVTESWAASPSGQSRLQRQVRELFANLNVRPEAVLAGNLIPFRSPSLSTLKNADAALRFGVSIWKRILDGASPKLIITMGSLVETSIARALEARFVCKHSLEWGAVSGRHWEFDHGELVALPHLSRFTVVTREASQKGLNELFGGRWVK